MFHLPRITRILSIPRLQNALRIRAIILLLVIFAQLCDLGRELAP